MKRNIWLLGILTGCLALMDLQAASAQETGTHEVADASDGMRAEQVMPSSSGVEIVGISWRGAFCVLNNCENRGAFSIDVRNTSNKTVTGVVWEFYLVDSVRQQTYDHFTFTTNDKKILPGSKPVRLTKRFDYHIAPDYLRARAVIMRVEYSDGSVWAKPEPAPPAREGGTDGWKIYNQADEGVLARALVLQGAVVGEKNKSAVLMLHKRSDGSWHVGFGLSIEGYTSPITIQCDDGEALDTVWKMTPDKGGKMAELPLSDDEEFLRYLETAHIFAVTYPRHPDMVKIVLRFDVRGLSGAIKQLEGAWR